MKTQLSFIDAHLEHFASPSTFDLPGEAAIAALKPGDFIKIGVRFIPEHGSICGERFWLQLTSIIGTNYVGAVNNDLVYTAEHGLSCEDMLSVQRCHILMVLHQPIAMPRRSAGGIRLPPGPAKPPQQA